MLKEKEFKRGFIQRTREARLTTGLTQEAIAKELGIKQDKYKQYEGRTMLPHQYIALFCAICDIRPADLFNLPLRFRDREKAEEIRRKIAGT